MYSVEVSGLLKFDFLGIRNLAILADGVSLVKRFYNIDIDIDKFPLNDKKLFPFLRQRTDRRTFSIKRRRYDQILERIKAHFHSRHQCDGRALSSGPDGNNSGIHQTQT